MENLTQLRARHAYAFIENHHSDDIGRIAKKLPVLFQTNGLLAGWAYLLANEKYKALLQDLLSHLRDETFHFELNGSGIDEETVFRQKWIRTTYPSFRLRSITDELIAYSGWLKRAAETYIQD